jgi:hypothetical protein
LLPAGLPVVSGLWDGQAGGLSAAGATVTMQQHGRAGEHRGVDAGMACLVGAAATGQLTAIADDEDRCHNTYVGGDLNKGIEETDPASRRTPSCSRAAG